MNNIRIDKLNSALLLIPDKDDIERDAVAQAWAKLGGSVQRIGRFWEPPLIDNPVIRLYGNNIFCLILSQKLGLNLVSPQDDFLLLLGDKWVNRRIGLNTLEHLENIEYPCFVKPLVPKLFRESVYKDMQALKDECIGLESSTKILISEIINITSEIRAFILNGEITSLALYEGVADLKEGKAFLEEFIAANEQMLPKAVVIDIGNIENRGWAIVEANAAWGAGLNGCDPEKAALCIFEATN